MSTSLLFQCHLYTNSIYIAFISRLLIHVSAHFCNLQLSHNKNFPSPVLNVAAGKAPMQSSVAEGGIPQKAVDGSTSTFFDLSTCSLTEVEKSPWWYVNLLEPYMVQLVRIDFGQSCCGKSRQGWNGSARLLTMPSTTAC